jgi:site-specific recombinase XerD
MKSIVSNSSVDQGVEQYQQHLINVAGLQPSTCQKWTFFVGLFLKAQFKPRATGVRLRDLRPEDLLEFVLQQGEHYPPGQLQSLASALRSFCRFLCVRGHQAQDLSPALPSISGHPREDLPTYLSLPQLKELLSAFDRRTLLGKRDYAVVLCLARLGLRAGEVAALSLDDVDWRQGSLRLAAPKGRRQRQLPLPEEVGQALVSYLHHARPLEQRGPLTTRLALDWVQIPPPGCSRQRARRLVALRHFATFWRAFDPRTQVPPAGLFGSAYGPRGPVHIYSPEQITTLLEATGQLSAEDLLFNLLYHTGARVSEALALRQRDLGWGPPSVLQFHGKGRKERAVPLLKPLHTELRHYLNGLPQQLDALIFHNRFEQPLSRWGVVRRLQQTAQRASQHCPTLKNRVVSPHTFRHTTALRLLQAEVDIRVIALLLGHESPTTTHHYIELDLQMKERCRRKLQSPKNKATRFKPTDALLQWLNHL